MIPTPAVPPSEAEALAEVLGEVRDPGDHSPNCAEGEPCRYCTDLAAAILASDWLREHDARVRAEGAREVLEEARDALYCGEGPDMFDDADIVYGEWLGNRAAALTPTEAPR